MLTPARGSKPSISIRLYDFIVLHSNIWRFVSDSNLSAQEKEKYSMCRNMAARKRLSDYMLKYWIFIKATETQVFLYNNINDKISNINK